MTTETALREPTALEIIILEVGSLPTQAKLLPKKFSPAFRICNFDSTDMKALLHNVKLGPGSSEHVRIVHRVELIRMNEQ